MRIAFRVDASVDIGTGHISRCLALAAELKERGAQCTFVCRQIADAPVAMMKAQGFDLVRLREPDDSASAPPADSHRHHWLAVSQEEDAREVASRLAPVKYDWLVVDHYALDSRWERSLSSVAVRILVIDDLADRSHDCDVLLDQNLYRDMLTRYAGKLPDGSRALLGPRFALLRSEFRAARASARQRTGTPRSVLIFFGGADAAGGTLAALDAMVRLRPEQMRVDVVIGAQHPLRRQIETCCDLHGFTLHVQTDRMAELMAAADLSIGAGGSASWERCCVGLPSFAIATASNQSQLVHDAAEAGLLYAPRVDPTDSDGIARHLRGLIENPELLASMSARAMKVVDGNGAARVARALGMTAVAVRPAESNDAPRIYEWRNHPAVRQVSRSTDIIEWSAHKAWFDAVLSDPCRPLLIGELKGRPVGVVRFDIAGRVAEVSIYMVEVQGGAGVGSDLLAAAENWLRRCRPDVGQLTAEVLGDNASSHGLFDGAGFRSGATHYVKRLDR